jgi:hypothetical protein
MGWKLVELKQKTPKYGVTHTQKRNPSKAQKPQNKIK